MVDVEVDRASMKFQLQTVNYVHFFIEAASIKSSKNLVPNQPTASSFLSHKSWLIQKGGTYAMLQPTNTFTNIADLIITLTEWTGNDSPRIETGDSHEPLFNRDIKLFGRM